MRIALFGRRDITGAGVFYAAFCDRLKALSFAGQMVEEVDISKPAVLESALRASDPSDINIWFQVNGRLRAARGTNICWAIFESSRLPPPYVALLRQAKVIWTPSDWARGVLIASGVPAQDVDVVPEGVDPALFHPHLRSRARDVAKPFHFLTIGKCETRKSYAELFEAFSLAFAGRDDTRLIVKADFLALTDGRHSAITALAAQHPSIEAQIKVLSGRLTHGDIAAIYGFADAFVFPSKAEGWGLPLIEAIAAGLPAITTDYSGHGHYLDGIRDKVAIVEHERALIEAPDYVKHWPAADPDLGYWAQPSVESLTAQMMAVRADHENAQKRAVEASAHIRRNFSWSNAAHTAMAHLRERGLLDGAFQIGLSFD